MIVPGIVAAPEIIAPTEKLIARALTRPGSLFDYRRWLCVDNVSHSFFDYECDLIAVSPAGYVSEIEIKTSIADLRRDQFKRRWTRGCREGLPVKYIWFAMPPSVLQHDDADDAMQKWCGLISVDVNAAPHLRCRVVRDATNRGGDKIADADRRKLLELASMRYWSRGDA